MDKPRPLRIHGPLGTGKSIPASYIFDDILDAPVRSTPRAQDVTRNNTLAGIAGAWRHHILNESSQKTCETSSERLRTKRKESPREGFLESYSSTPKRPVEQSCRIMKEHSMAYESPKFPALLELFGACLGESGKIERPVSVALDALDERINPSTIVSALGLFVKEIRASQSGGEWERLRSRLNLATRSRPSLRFARKTPVAASQVSFVARPRHFR